MSFGFNTARGNIDVPQGSTPKRTLERKLRMTEMFHLEELPKGSGMKWKAELTICSGISPSLL